VIVEDPTTVAIFLLH